MAQPEEDADLDHLTQLDHRNTGFYTGPRPRRDPITFVKGTGIDSTIPPDSAKSRLSMAETYRSIVLGKDSVTPNSIEAKPEARADLDITRSASAPPTTRPPHSSIAEQIELKYVKPPSNLDRTRKSFRYMEAQGWDPDRRAGLGANEEGIAFPVKATEKKDKAGIGVPQRTSSPRNAKPAKAQKLNAKQARRMAAEEKRKHERLQRLFYQDESIEKYLGSDAN